MALVGGGVPDKERGSASQGSPLGCPQRDWPSQGDLSLPTCPQGRGISNLSKVLGLWPLEQATTTWETGPRTVGSRVMAHGGTELPPGQGQCESAAACGRLLSPPTCGRGQRGCDGKLHQDHPASASWSCCLSPRPGTPWVLQWQSLCSQCRGLGSNP